MKFILYGCTPQQASQYITDYKYRNLWDVKFIKGEILGCANQQSAVVSETFANYNNGFQDQSIRNFILKRKIIIGNDNSVIINYKPAKCTVQCYQFTPPEGIQQAQIFKMSYIISDYVPNEAKTIRQNRLFSNASISKTTSKQRNNFFQQSPIKVGPYNQTINSAAFSPVECSSLSSSPILNGKLPKRTESFHTNRSILQSLKRNQPKYSEDQQKLVVIKYKCELDTRAADLLRGDILQENDDLIQSINSLQKLVNFGVETYQQEQKEERLCRMKSHNQFLQAVQRKNIVGQTKLQENCSSFTEDQMFSLVTEPNSLIGKEPQKEIQADSYCDQYYQILHQSINYKRLQYLHYLIILSFCFLQILIRICIYRSITPLIQEISRLNTGSVLFIKLLFKKSLNISYHIRESYIRSYSIQLIILN